MRYTSEQSVASFWVAKKPPIYICNIVYQYWSKKYSCLWNDTDIETSPCLMVLHISVLILILSILSTSCASEQQVVLYFCISVHGLATVPGREERRSQNDVIDCRYNSPNLGSWDQNKPCPFHHLGPARREVSSRWGWTSPASRKSSRPGCLKSRFEFNPTGPHPLKSGRKPFELARSVGARERSLVMRELDCSDNASSSSGHSSSASNKYFYFFRLLK